VTAFRFPLQPLLDHRTALAAEVRTELLRAERAASLEREALASLEEQFAALSTTFAGGRESDPSALRRTLLEIEVVRPALEARRTAAARANDLVRAAREAYVAARRERERLQALRDRAYHAFLSEADHREDREHDEANAAGRTLAP
jgi:flagellar export protein FliJ